MSNIFLKIEDLKSYPTLYNNVHESIYRSYHALELIYEMCAKGYDQSQIMNFIDAYRDFPKVDDKRGETVKTVNGEYYCGNKD